MWGLPNGRNYPDNRHWKVYRWGNEKKVGEWWRKCRRRHLRILLDWGGEGKGKEFFGVSGKEMEWWRSGEGRMVWKTSTGDSGKLTLSACRTWTGQSPYLRKVRDSLVTLKISSNFVSCFRAYLIFKCLILKKRSKNFILRKIIFYQKKKKILPSAPYKKKLCPKIKILNKLRLVEGPFL